MAAVRLNSELPTLVELLPRAGQGQAARAARASSDSSASQRNEWVYFQPRELASARRNGAGQPCRATLRELAELAVVRLRAGIPRPGDPHARPQPAVRIAGDRFRNQRAAQGGRIRTIGHRGPLCPKPWLPAAGNTAIISAKLGSAACGHCDNCVPQPAARRRPATRWPPATERACWTRCGSCSAASPAHAAAAARPCSPRCSAAAAPKK